MTANDYCLTQPQIKCNCSPILMFCKAQFWLDLSEEICLRQVFRQCLEEGVGMFLAFAMLLGGKHFETTPTKLPG